jgi:hypothetical protein
VSSKKETLALLALSLEVVARVNHDANPREIDDAAEAELREFAAALRRVLASTEQLIRHAQWCRGEGKR